MLGTFLLHWTLMAFSLLIAVVSPYFINCPWYPNADRVKYRTHGPIIGQPPPVNTYAVSEPNRNRTNNKKTNCIAKSSRPATRLYDSKRAGGAGAGAGGGGIGIAPRDRANALRRASHSSVQTFDYRNSLRDLAHLVEDLKDVSNKEQYDNNNSYNSYNYNNKALRRTSHSSVQTFDYNYNKALRRTSHSSVQTRDLAHLVEDLKDVSNKEHDNNNSYNNFNNSYNNFNNSYNNFNKAYLNHRHHHQHLSSILSSNSLSCSQDEQLMDTQDSSNSNMERTEKIQIDDISSEDDDSDQEQDISMEGSEVFANRLHMWQPDRAKYMTTNNRKNSAAESCNDDWRESHAELREHQQALDKKMDTVIMLLQKQMELNGGNK